MTSSKAVNSGQTEREAYRDAVTRKQIEAWAKLAGIEHFTEKGLERLGDFAIFARQARAASTATAMLDVLHDSNRENDRAWSAENRVARAAAPQGLTDALHAMVKKWERWQADGERRGCPQTNGMGTAITDLRAILADQSPAPASPSGEVAAERSAAPMAAANQAHAVDGAEASVPSIAAHLWMPAEIPEPIEAPQDFGDRKAYAFKDPKAGEHDPWYVVLPNMNAVKLGYHADDTTDKAHAEYIASAINRAMALPPAIKQALKRFGESQFHCGHDQATSEFKNFHRLLCERFGYVHDERNWQRDQLSLIEWIASDLPRASEQATKESP